jgi:hypothetical protein
MMKLPVTTCPQQQLFSSYCIPQPANFNVVLLIYSLTWWSILVVDNTFMIKETVNMVLTLLQLCHTLFGCGDSCDFHWEDWAFVSGSLLMFQASLVHLQHEIHFALVTGTAE